MKLIKPEKKFRPERDPHLSKLLMAILFFSLKFRSRLSCIDIFDNHSCVLLSNSNWTEWSTIQGVIERVISKSNEREARG